VSLVPGKELLLAAGAKGRAVGAFNFNNLEFLQAIVGAADARQTPVFRAPSMGAGLRVRVSTTEVDCTNR